MRNRIPTERVAAAAAMLLLFGCVLAAGAAAGKGKSSFDWPHWRGPNYDGVSREAEWCVCWPAEGPKIIWRASVGTGFSSIAVAEGRAYTMGNVSDRDIVYCFDAEKGVEIWKHSYPQPLAAKYYEGGTSATPTVDGGVVYTFAKAGDVFALDAANGEVIWHRNVQKDLGAKRPTWGFAGSPVIIGKLVILNAGDAAAALDKKTGKTVWKSGAGPAGYATPVPFKAGGRQAVAVFSRDSLLAVAVADGRKLWSFPWKTQYDVNAADPIIFDSKVFISSGYNRGCALLDISGAAPKPIYENRRMRNHFNSTVLYEGHLYGFDETTLKCLEFKTGREMWSHSGLGKGSLMIADGRLIVLSDKGKLVVAPASPAAFKPIRSGRILSGKCWTVPVLSGARLYARNAAGQLVCVDMTSDK